MTVTGLAPGEKVAIRYQGRVVRTGRAGAAGKLVHRFRAGTVWGSHGVTVVARRTDRTVKATFLVGRRCPDGVWTCP